MTDRFIVNVGCGMWVVGKDPWRFGERSCAIFLREDECSRLKKACQEDLFLVGGVSPICMRWQPEAPWRMWATPTIRNGQEIFQDVFPHMRQGSVLVEVTLGGPYWGWSGPWGANPSTTAVPGQGFPHAIHFDEDNFRWSLGSSVSLLETAGVGTVLRLGVQRVQCRNS